MTVIILTNLILAAIALASIIGLLAAGIVTAPFDRGMTLARRRHARPAPGPLAPAAYTSGR